MSYSPKMRQIEKTGPISTHFSSKNFINLLQARDRTAVSELVQAYTGQLLRATYGLGFDQNSGQELVQSVWATFFDSVARFEGRSHIRTFIFGILYNKASELRRNQIRMEDHDPIEDVLEARFDTNGKWIKPPVNPEEFLIGVDTVDLIQKCLEALPINQRMAFVLKEVEERESPEICKILDITVTHLGVLFYRARNRLRECVESKIMRQEA